MEFIIIYHEHYLLLKSTIALGIRKLMLLSSVFIIVSNANLGICECF